MVAGIDTWQFNNREKWIRGLACRVQWGTTDWQSFTIRKSRISGTKTEYEKRLDALTNGRGFLFPPLTVQAYLKQRRMGPVMSIGIAKTVNIMRWIHCHRDEVKVQTNPIDGTEFYVVFWRDIEPDVRVIVDR